MNCPNCAVALISQTVGIRMRNSCPQCGGSWCNVKSLRVLAEAAEAEQATKKCPDTGDKFCPECERLLERFHYFHDSNIFLHRCIDCHGIWAEEGQLAQVAQYLEGDETTQRIVKDMLAENNSKQTTRLLSRLLYSRLLSAAIALLYLLLTLALGDGEAVMHLIIYLILPLACIWFAKSMGEGRGIIGIHPGITRSTPAIFVALGGWMLLLLPVVLGIITALRQ